MRETKVFKTREESRAANKDYIDEHISNVKKAFDLVGEDICRYVYKAMNFSKEDPDKLDVEEYISLIRDYLIPKHDESKYEPIEFDAYAAKFFPCEEDLQDPESVKKNFDLAWDHHKKVNRHHPDEWVLGHGFGNELDTIRIPMPFIYFIEMLMDWTAMSIKFNQSTYDWWFNDPNGRKEKIEMFSNNRLALIDLVITEFKDRLDFSK